MLALAGPRRCGARRTVLAAVAALSLTAALSGCQGTPSSAGAADSSSRSTDSASPSPAPSATARVVVTPRAGTQDVAVDTPVTVTVGNATLQKVTVTGPAGALRGTLADNGYSWKAADRLEPGTGYQVTAVATDESGDQVVRHSRFRTADLSLAQQTYPSIAPLAGETVGIGMPVIVTFDVPVTDRASIEKHLSVTSSPAQPGAWHWISDTEVHFRPRSYWKAGTDVHVDVDINSVPAGNGIYGQESRSIDFQVGDAHVYKVDAQTHQMRVFSNGRLLRTIPITTGKPGFTTRSGTKVIIEKFASRRMNSETVGIPADSPEAYDIDDVQWAMRLTYSGEFIHAAPWSVSSQGHANVSHGCTGMSTENAHWLFDLTRRGDVVEYTGTDRPMTLTNGYGDWNESFAQYSRGSALS